MKLTYSYILREADGSVTYEGGHGRDIDLKAYARNEVLFIDAWNDASYYENAFYTEPFRCVLLKTENKPSPALANFTHHFRIKSPLLQKNQTLCLLGDNQSLRDWNTRNPILLNPSSGDGFYSVSLDLAKESFPIAYKYGVYDLEAKKFLRYESDDNRILHDAVSKNKVTILHDGFAVLPATTWKGAGIAIPVFSLRSETSFGIGQFTDLKLLADWCHQVGLKLIQILPVNDTTATHSGLIPIPTRPFPRLR